MIKWTKKEKEIREKAHKHIRELCFKGEEKIKGDGINGK